MGKGTPFYRKVSKVTLTHKDKDNPYKDENWYASEIDKQVSEPSGRKPKRKSLRTGKRAINARKNAIVKAVKSTPLTTDEIEKLFNYRYRGSQHILTQLKQDGRIEKRGRYWVPSKSHAEFGEPVKIPDVEYPKAAEFIRKEDLVEQEQTKRTEEQVRTKDEVDVPADETEPAPENYQADGGAYQTLAEMVDEYRTSRDAILDEFLKWTKTR